MRSYDEIKKIIFTDFTDKKVTNGSKKQVMDYPRLFRGSVKTSLGKFYTTDEYDKKRSDVLKIKLP